MKFYSYNMAQTYLKFSIICSKSSNINKWRQLCKISISSCQLQTVKVVSKLVNFRLSFKVMQASSFQNMTVCSALFGSIILFLNLDELFYTNILVHFQLLPKKWYKLHQAINSVHHSDLLKTNGHIKF